MEFSTKFPIASDTSEMLTEKIVGTLCRGNLKRLQDVKGGGTGRENPKGPSDPGSEEVSEGIIGKHYTFRKKEC